MNREMKKSLDDTAGFELREPAVAYMAGKPPVEPWMAAGDDDADDWDCELTDEELDRIDIPGVTVHSWDEFYRMLEEGAAALAAGRVTPHEQVFEELERKILTGRWDD